MPPPNYIPIPPPPSFDESDPPTPYYTPPQSPINSPSVFYTPPSSPASSPNLMQLNADCYPANTEITLDLALDDDGLTTLEKIYLYSRSKASFHRVFIAHALPSYLLSVTPQEAVEYVLPLLSNLAMDEDEPVKEALAAELVPIIWWFFTHCQIIPDDPGPEETFASSSSTITISVQAFTPILGTLLLSSNPLVGGSARFAIVDLLGRMKKADDRESGNSLRVPSDRAPHIVHPWEIAQGDDDDDDDDSFATGLFGLHERALFTQEILQQIVIGMARLDLDDNPDRPQSPVPTDFSRQFPKTSPRPVSREGSRTRDDNYNPYFPPIPSSTPSSSTLSSWSTPLPTSSGSYPRTPPSNRFSPGTEYPPKPPPNKPRSPLSSSNSMMDDDIDAMYGDENDEQAAVGRLSSMSLMAAVTASGVLEQEIQLAFVKEVERVGHDPVYWVRREASFALGALAKVVPQEVVISALLPLFNSLLWDSVWHVRHSALFALPAILARLSKSERRNVAVNSIVVLAADQNATVRSGVLEAIGEVIYSFQDDPDGPPQKLVDLFLGRKEDAWLRSGQTNPRKPATSQTPLESFYTDLKRPLICAFNFPAVALSLGPSRWLELRDAYLDMTRNSTCGVQRTLAASLGEIAKIIGKEHALQDLIGFWWVAIRSEDEEVRLKAIESLGDLFKVIGAESVGPFLNNISAIWNEGVLRTWRERAAIEKSIATWPVLPRVEDSSVAIQLVVSGLEDKVAAVREEAMASMVHLTSIFSTRSELARQLRHSLLNLSTSSAYRQRMTFIACQQALLKGQLTPATNDLVQSVAVLANDAIEGVRIGVARLVGILYGDLRRKNHPVPPTLTGLVHQLLADSSQDVRAYLPELSQDVPMGDSNVWPPEMHRQSRRKHAQLTTFSRPPPHRSGTNPPLLESNGAESQPERTSSSTDNTDQPSDFAPLTSQMEMSLDITDDAELYPSGARNQVHPPLNSDDFFLYASRTTQVNVPS